MWQYQLWHGASRSVCHINLNKQSTVPHVVVIRYPGSAICLAGKKCKTKDKRQTWTAIASDSLGRPMAGSGQPRRAKGTTNANIFEMMERYQGLPLIRRVNRIKGGRSWKKVRSLQNTDMVSHRSQDALSNMQIRYSCVLTYENFSCQNNSETTSMRWPFCFQSFRKQAVRSNHVPIGRAQCSAQGREEMKHKEMKWVWWQNPIIQLLGRQGWGPHVWDHPEEYDKISSQQLNISLKGKN